MRVTEPSYEILSVPDGEQALALLERVGRVAYKSEDKIDPGEHCVLCSGKGMESWALPFDQTTAAVCPDCSGTGWKREPSSHKFVKMILKAERKAEIIQLAKETMEEGGRGTDVNFLTDSNVARQVLAEKLVQNIVGYMEENPPHESVIEHCSATVLFTSNRGFTHELVRHRLAAFTQSSTRYCDYSKGKFGQEISCTHQPAYTAEGVGVLGLAEWEQAMKDADYHYQQLRKMGFKPQIARGVLPQDLVADIVCTANFREWRHIFRMRCAPAAHPDMRRLMIPLREEFRRRIPIIFDAR